MSEETGPPSEESSSEAHNDSEHTANVQDRSGGIETGSEIEPFTIGSKAPEKKPENLVHTSEASPEDKPPKGKSNEAEATPDVPPPRDLRAGEEDRHLNVRAGDATWENQDSSTPVEVTGYLGERDGRHYVSIAGSETGVPLDEIRYPTDEPEESSQGDNTQPLEQSSEQRAGLGQRIMGRLGKALGRSTESPTPGQPGTEQPTQKQILQEKIDERRVAFETAADVSSINLNNGQLQGVKFDTARSNPYVVRGADGNDRYLPKNEFDKILKSDITREEKRSGQPETHTQISDEDIATKLEEFKTDDRKRGTVRFGKQELTYQGFDGSEKPEPYVFKEKGTGTELSLSEADVQGIIRDELRLESKVIEDSKKFGAQAQEKLAQVGRSLEEVSERAASLLSSAKESKVGGFLLEQGKAFLNKFDPRDKEKIPYFAGLAVGAGSNVALTYFTPFLAFGPGRLVRSAAFSGVMLGVSKGANVFRHMSMNKVLSNFGVEDKAERTTYSKQYDEAFKLLSKSNEEEYGEAMKKLSTDIFAKHGNAQSGSNVEGAAAHITAEELQKRIESLSTKYQKLNNQIRSFSAGLSAGSIGATLGVGFASILESGGSGGISPGEGGEATPTPDEPTEAPGGGVEPTPTTEPTPEPDPTPTTEPEPTPTETPTAEPSSLSEILANPEYASSLEIQQGDTIGQLLTDGGYDIDWGPDNAQVFGAHIEANYDMLQGMNEQVAAAGVSVEDFPTQGEISTLVSQARAGDAVAMHRLTEAMHWVPTGGEFTILSPEAVELINNPQGG